MRFGSLPCVPVCAALGLGQGVDYIWAHEALFEPPSWLLRKPAPPHFSGLQVPVFSQCLRLKSLIPCIVL